MENELFLVIGLISLAFIGLSISSIFIGIKKTFVALSLITLCAFPIFLTPTSMLPHVGIAPLEPEVSTYGFVLAIATLLIAFSRFGIRSVWIFTPLLIWLALGLSNWWEGSPGQLSGALQLGMAPLAWVLGAYAFSASGGSVTKNNFLVKLVISLLILQATVIFFQFFGFAINDLSDSQKAILGNRFNGTFDHPNNLGKAVVLLLILVLPLAVAGNRHRNTSVVFAYLVGLFVLALTGGRAVLLSALLLPVVWILLGPRTRGSVNRKTNVVLSVLTASVLVSSVFLARFDEDPVGGDRSVLLSVALQQFRETPIFGIGPNSYVEVVGQFSPITASGVPVHNAFLLALVELGVFGAIFLFLPIIWMLFRCLRNWRAPSIAGAYARAGISSIPIVLIIGTTGWGLLGGSILPLFFFVFGFLNQGIGTSTSSFKLVGSSVA